MEQQERTGRTALQRIADIILLRFIIERLRGLVATGPEEVKTPAPPEIGPIAAGPPPQVDLDPGPPVEVPKRQLPPPGPWPGPQGGDPRPPSPVRARFLCVDAPERAPLDSRLSVHVQVTLDQPPAMRSAGLKPLDVPPEGADITITVSAPGLVPTGDLEQELHVPADGDSEPVRFGFTADRAGLHTIVVRAFRGGTFLGSLSTQLSVQNGAPVEEGRRHVAELEDLTPEPGEVTILITETADGRYSFQLRAEGLSTVLSEHLAGDPGHVVDMMVDELRRLAAGDSPYRTVALQQAHLRNLGVNLWADAVPAAIRRQFWTYADRIRSLTVISDTDIVPWELLYPLDGDNDRGFLVQQFPVVRRVASQRRTRKLPVRSAAYVVPSRAPANALAEVDLIRHRLSGRIAESTMVDQLSDLLALLETPPGLLHFACHNDFADGTGSVVPMSDGPLRPVDLAAAVQTNGLADAGPLVFFNACRTAGQVPGLLKMMGWAQQFMAAGAGAFLGSLWAVRSRSASEFADAFYESFVSRRLPLGEASMAARQRIITEDGDPTWLAYTVYGNPAATVSD